MINTNGGLFAINNTTRYNTDDLLRVFNDFEAKLMEKQGKLPAVTEPTTIDIVDFKPADPSRVVREYDHVTNTYRNNVNSRWYVKESSYGRSTRNKIGLLPPDLLYASPLEALAADQTKAPVAMTFCLIERLRTLYTNISGVDWQKSRSADEALREDYKTSPPTLGILAKRASFNAKELKDRRTKERADAYSRSLLHDLDSAYRMLVAIEKHHNSAKGALVAAGIESAQAASFLQQAIGFTGYAYNGLLKAAKG